MVCTALGAYETAAAAWAVIKEMADTEERRDPTGVVTLELEDADGPAMQFQMMRHKCVVVRRPVEVTERVGRQIEWTTRMARTGKRNAKPVAEMIVAIEDLTERPFDFEAGT